MLIECSSWYSGMKIRYALPTDRGSSRGPCGFYLHGKLNSLFCYISCEIFLYSFFLTPNSTDKHIIPIRVVRLSK